MKKRVLSVLLALSLLLTMCPQVASADILNEDLPTVNANSYIVIDGDSEQVLFGSKYDKEIDPGAMVQIMTAIIIIEEGNLNDSVTVPEIPDAANEGNRLYLRKGEKVNLSDLLEGIILYNANDAAVAAAVHIAGSEEAFVDTMNERASKMGLESTIFKSVYGAAEGQVTTARDLAVLSSYASNLPKYVEFAIEPSMSWDSEMNQSTTLVNVNDMQNVDNTSVGIKVESGDSTNLTASISKSDRTVVGVILGANDEDDAYYEMQDAITFGYENTAIKKLVTKNDPITTINFTDKKSVRVAASKNYATTVSTADSSSLSSMINIDKPELPISEGDTVGSIKIYRDGDLIDEVPLVALDSAGAGIDWKFTFVCLIAIVLFILLVYIIFLSRFGNKPRPRTSKPKQAPHRNTSTTRAHAPQQQQRRTPSSAQTQRLHNNAPQHSNVSLKSASQKMHNTTSRNVHPSNGSASGREALERRPREKNEASRGGKY